MRQLSPKRIAHKMPKAVMIEEKASAHDAKN
jgi:hypothetical protein